MKFLQLLLLPFLLPSVHSAPGDACSTDSDCVRGEERCVGVVPMCEELKDEGEVCITSVHCKRSLFCQPTLDFWGICIDIGACFDDSDCGLFGVCPQSLKCTSSICFSGRSTVEVKGEKTPVRMDALKIGDYVRTRSGTFSQVHGFGHYQPNVKANFLQIQTTKIEKPLEISEEHMLYVLNAITYKEEVAAASSVKLGDFLILANGGEPSQVISIRKIQARGAFAPLTVSGDVAVNDVVASSYVSRSWISSHLVSGQTLHLLQHGATTARRLFCSYLSCEEETYDPSTGFSSLVTYWFEWEQWQLQLGAVARTLFLLILMPLALCIIAIGRLHLMPNLSLTQLLAAVMGILVLKRLSKDEEKQKTKGE